MIMIMKSLSLLIKTAVTMLYTSIQYNPAELWKYLKDRYGIESNIIVTQTVKIKFNKETFNIKNDSVHHMATYLQQLQLQLIGSEIVIKDIDMSMKLLDSLPSKYNIAVEDIYRNHWKDLDKFNIIVSKMEVEELVINRRASITDTTNSSHKVLATVSTTVNKVGIEVPSWWWGKPDKYDPNYRSKYNTNDNKGKKNNEDSKVTKSTNSKKCHYCGRAGHAMEDCQIMKSIIEEFRSVPKDTKDSNLKVNVVTFTGISSIW